MTREVQHAAVEVARPLTFAVLIIMTVYGLVARGPEDAPPLEENAGAETP